MPRVIREEFQDKEGNVHYLHTEDCVVWTEDGKSIRDAMKQVDFEDYTTEQPPTLKEALAAFTKNHSWTELFSSIKAICMRVSSGTNISSDFSSAKTYNIGDYCIYNNTLYKFTAKHDAGEWIGTDAKEVNLTDELIGQNDKIPRINNTLTSSATDQALSAAQGKALSDRVGTLASLETSAKEDLVAAVNEVNGILSTVQNKMARIEAGEIIVTNKKVEIFSNGEGQNNVNWENSNYTSSRTDNTIYYTSISNTTTAGILMDEIKSVNCNGSCYVGFSEYNRTAGGSVNVAIINIAGETVKTGVISNIKQQYGSNVTIDTPVDIVIDTADLKGYHTIEITLSIQNNSGAGGPATRATVNTISLTT